MNKKCIIILLVANFPFMLAAQKSINNFFINGVVGIKDISNIRTAPTFGFEVGLKNIPFSLNYRKSISTEAIASFYPLGEIDRYRSYNIFEVDYRYHTKRNIPVRVGAGYFHKDIRNAYWGGVIYKGVTAHVNLRLNSFEVEARAEVPVIPFDLLDNYIYSLSFIKRIGVVAKEERKEHKNNFFSKNLETRFLYTSRLFKINYPEFISDTLYSYHNKFGISMGIGVEFYIPKYKVGINIEKDWWLNFIPKLFTPHRIIDQYVSNTVIGARYYIPQKRNPEKSIKIGTGIYLGVESSTLLSDLLLMRKPNAVHNRVGIPLSIAYPLTEKIDLETRYIYMTKNEKPFNIARLSLGAVCRFE